MIVFQNLIRDKVEICKKKIDVWKLPSPHVDLLNSHVEMVIASRSVHLNVIVIVIVIVIVDKSFSHCGCRCCQAEGC